MPNNETSYEKIFTYNPITNLQQLQAEADNFKKLFGVANLCADVLQDYERDGWLVTFNKKGTAEKIWLLTIVNKSSFFAYAVLIVQKKNWLGKITDYVLEVGFSDEQKNSGEIFTKKSNADYDALFVTLWQGILKDAELGVNYYKLFHKTVDAPNAYNWFSLPIVTEPEAEKIYSSYEESSDEWRGFWNDEYMFSFRQKNKETQAPAILQVARKILISDVFDTRSYRIWFIETGASLSVLLKYNSSQEGKYDDRYQSINGALVFPFDWEKYKEAIDWYKDAEKLIVQANQFYLEDKEDNYQNNLPLIERDAKILLRDFSDELFFNEALFGHTIERLTFGNYYKQTEKQFVSFEHLSLSANVIWNEDKSIGYGFNQQEGRFTQLLIILTENGKTEAAELFIYHLNKEKNIVYCYHLPKGESIDSKDLPKFLITENTEKQIIVSTIEQFHSCEDYFETKDEEMNDAANTQKVFTKPYETVTMDGIAFKVIDIHQANNIIKDLTDLEGDKLYNVYTNQVMFPLYEENTFFLLAEEDVEAEEFSIAFNNDEFPNIFILGFIFLKNLTTKKYVEGCEIDVSPVMIVLGKLTTINLMVVGNTHYIGNGIECETIWGMYNHGSLYVKGETEAHLIYADDMEMHFEKFKGLGVAVSSSHGLNIFTTTHLPQDDGTTLLQEYNVLNTHKLSDCVADEYIFISEYGEEMISDDGSGKAYEAMMQGKSIIDWNKEGRVMYGHFISYFQKKIGALLQLPAMQQNGFLEWKEEDSIAHYFAQILKDNDVWHLQIGRNIKVGDTIICCRIFFPTNKEGLESHEVQLLFYGEGYTHKFSWTNNIWALTIEARIVKCAIVETFEKFLGKEEVHFSELETKRKPAAQPDLLPVYLVLINYVAVPQAVKEDIHASLIQAFENPKSFYDEEDEFILSDRGLTFATHKNLTPKFVFIDKLIEANQMAEVDWKADEAQIRFSINKILAAKNFDFKLLDEIKYSVDALGIIQSINNLELKPAGYALALLDIDSDSYVFTVVLLDMQKEVEELFAQL